MFLILISVILAVVGIAALILCFGKELKKIIIFGLVPLIVAVVLFSFWLFKTESGQRTIKTWKSETSGGLERIVEVYDQNGNLIKTYEGKLDVEDTEYGNKVLFDLDGKRVIIYNATVVVEEK